MNPKQLLLLACVLLCSGNAWAQSPDKDADKEKDAAAIIELGGAAGVTFGVGGATAGGAATGGLAGFPPGKTTATVSG